MLADGTITDEHLSGVLGSGAAGSAEWLGEQLLRGSLNRTAAVAARQIAARADDDRLVPGQLIGQALHALGPVDQVRERWRTATSPPEPQPPPRADQAARVSAALARSPAHLAGRAVPHPDAAQIPRVVTAPVTRPHRSPS